MLKLIHYLEMDQPDLPPIPWPTGYVLAANGVFAWASRPGLEALIPVTEAAGRPIRGLYPVSPYVRLASHPVEQCHIEEMFRLAHLAACGEEGPKEMLFYFRQEATGWSLTVPEQDQSSMRVAPVVSAAAMSLYAETILEIHSHNTMSAFFSQTDTADEQGFRLYGVIGRVGGSGLYGPEIRMRVGVYGHFWDIPASMVLELPWWVVDCAKHEREPKATRWFDVVVPLEESTHAIS